MEYYVAIKNALRKKVKAYKNVRQKERAESKYICSVISTI